MKFEMSEKVKDNGCYNFSLLCRLIKIYGE